MWNISLRCVEKPNYSISISDMYLDRRKWLYSFWMMLKICTKDKAAFLNKNIFKSAVGGIWKELSNTLKQMLLYNSFWNT